MKPEVPFIYLAGKYTEASTYLVQRNIALAMHYAQEVAIMGAMPITPHLLSANMDGIQHYQWWCDVTMQLMRKCDAVLMLPNYDRSNGAVAELVDALRLGMPVFYCLGELRLWLADNIDITTDVDPDYVPPSPEALAQLHADIESMKSGQVIFRDENFSQYADDE